MGKTQTTPSKPRLFQLGDAVTAIAFTDCFGEYQKAKPGLVVTECKTIVSTTGFATYHRIKAMGPDGYHYVEGAERFFEAA